MQKSVSTSSVRICSVNRNSRARQWVRSGFHGAHREGGRCLQDGVLGHAPCCSTTLKTHPNGPQHNPSLHFSPSLHGHPRAYRGIRARRGQEGLLTSGEGRAGWQEPAPPTHTNHTGEVEETFVHIICTSGIGRSPCA